MLYILILLSLTGIGISLSKWYKREHSQESEMETEDETENHPVAQIKSVLFLEVPLEKIIMGYFIITALVYSSMLVFGFTLPELDLALLLFSGIITLLLIYNLVTVFAIAEWFSWRVFFIMHHLSPDDDKAGSDWYILVAGCHALYGNRSSAGVGTGFGRRIDSRCDDFSFPQQF